MTPYKERAAMNMKSRRPLLLGAALLLAVGTPYGCKEFLEENSVPQGALDAKALAKKNGVEGSRIAAYRSLDYTNGVGGAWGSAASNWIWGSITTDDAYKGSEASDQPALDPIEFYQWSASTVESELNDKWRAMYEGIVRANATI